MLTRKLVSLSFAVICLATLAGCCHCPEPTTTVVTTPEREVHIIETQPTPSVKPGSRR